MSVGLLFFMLSAHAQSENLVKVIAQAGIVNDSTYSLKASLQLEKGWHIYGDNPDGIKAPSLF
jgi:hypothetical protein